MECILNKYFELKNACGARAPLSSNYLPNCYFKVTNVALLIAFVYTHIFTIINTIQLSMVNGINN